MFAPGPDTLRGDAAGPLRGHDAISTFRGGRGGAPKRRIVEVEVRALGEDHAAVVAITEPLRGGRGQQTQVWRRGEDGWKVAVAHVAVAPPAMDRRIWRVLGAPLVPASLSAGGGSADEAPGPLTGERIAVKDVIAVAGQRIGGGAPPCSRAPAPSPVTPTRWSRCWTRAPRSPASQQPTSSPTASPAPTPTTAPRRTPAPRTGSAVAPPPAPRRPCRWGTRASGSAPTPAAPSGSPPPTRGCGRRAPPTAPCRATGVAPRAELRHGRPAHPHAGPPRPRRRRAPARGAGRARGPRARTVPGLETPLNPEVADALDTALARWRTAIEIEEADPLDADELTGFAETFRLLQAREAWAAHGEWVSAHRSELAPDVGARFDAVAQVTADEAADAQQARTRAVGQIRRRLGEGVLVVPGASSIAPLVRDAAAGGPAIEAQRARTMRLTCLAGLAGLPAVAVPLVASSGLPTAVTLVGPPGGDLALIDLATRLEEDTAPPLGPAPGGAATTDAAPTIGTAPGRAPA
ncbi:AtzH-like domain-containing protein [Brachybacterium sp. GPGPB12]|uniref:AtzH-like domain-containing protein n=1 Tax=Brachybacterium sp. GPGPB12 TaxID=3023517 RepID=UPI00313451AC